MLGYVVLASGEIVALLLVFLQNYVNPVCAPRPALPSLCNLLSRCELEIKYRISGTVLHSCGRASSLGAQITPKFSRQPAAPACRLRAQPLAGLVYGGRGEMNILLGISEDLGLGTVFSLGKNSS